MEEPMDLDRPIPGPIEGNASLDPEMARNEARLFNNLQGQIISKVKAIALEPPEYTEYIGRHGIVVTNVPEQGAGVDFVTSGEVDEQSPFPFDTKALERAYLGEVDQSGLIIKEQYNVDPKYWLELDRSGNRAEHYYFDEKGNYVKLSIRAFEQIRKDLGEDVDTGEKKEEMTAEDFELVGAILNTFDKEIDEAIEEEINKAANHQTEEK